MRKKMIRMAMLGCAFALSLAPVSAVAAPRAEQATEVSTEDIVPDTVEADDTANADGTEDHTAEAEDVGRTGDTREMESPEAAREMDETEEAGGTGDAGETDGTAGGVTDETNGNATDIGRQERKTAEQLKAEKGSAAPITDVTKDADDGEEDLEAEDGDMEYDEEEEKTSYTAPEDSRHANVSFFFAQVSSSAYFSKLTYPLTLSLKEVDTGDRVMLTVKSEGQILEVEKGDYAVKALKDSGRIPLSVAGDTLHIYENTVYPVRFAANNALKMFTDFLTDNIFLVCFFAFAALFYKKAIIPRFASDVRRK